MNTMGEILKLLKLKHLLLIFLLSGIDNILYARTIIVLIGAPGIGKTSLGLKLQKESNFLFFNKWERFAGDQQVKSMSLLKKDDKQAFWHEKTKLYGEVVKENTSANGFIFQSEEVCVLNYELFKTYLEPDDKFLFIQLKANRNFLTGGVLERVLKRRTCSNYICGQVYGKKSPRFHGICDDCGHKLSYRSVDNPVDHLRRVDEYLAIEKDLINKIENLDEKIYKIFVECNEQQLFRQVKEILQDYNERE